jgi:hypothetical protein
MAYRALLIGNNAYPRSPLSKCINDVTRMKEVLEAGGFHVVTLHTDLNKADTLRAVDSFVASLPQGCMVYIHFSGHGVVVGKDSSDVHWIPVDGTSRGSCRCCPLAEGRGRGCGVRCNTEMALSGTRKDTPKGMKAMQTGSIHPPHVFLSAAICVVASPSPCWRACGMCHVCFLPVRREGG